MTPRIEASRRLVEMVSPIALDAVVAVVAVVAIVVFVVPVAVAAVVDIFYQGRGYIPRWLLPGMF
jgi:hypothetical protein